jgi:hypothetical protein
VSEKAKVNSADVLNGILVQPQGIVETWNEGTVFYGLGRNSEFSLVGFTTTDFSSMCWGPRALIIKKQGRSESESTDSGDLDPRLFEMSTSWVV